MGGKEGGTERAGEGREECEESVTYHVAGTVSQPVEGREELQLADVSHHRLDLGADHHLHLYVHLYNARASSTTNRHQTVDT